MLQEILDRLTALPPEARKQLEDYALDATKHLKFIPNTGPQLLAYNSAADILLYGGEPGGGKTALLIGLALNEHQRSLIVRKQFTDLEGVVDNAKDMIGGTDGFVGGSRPKYNKPDGGVIHFQGMSQGEGIDTSKQGTPHDFIGIDEGAQLPENAIRLLLGWNRTKKPGQRCRMVIASNPPTDSVGDWLIDFFGPWLNHNHPRPAKPGELRWFIINEEGKSQEVEDSSPLTINGEKYEPHSRSFIRAGLEDNPYINADDYRKRLQAMPEPYRSILISGNFMLARKDDEWQCIPTAWIREAQARWKPKPPDNVPMCAMGVDPAAGGEDKTVLAWRHDGWYAPLLAMPGAKTPLPRDVAGLIFANRRDSAEVVLDMGGGYGGGILEHLKDNDVKTIPYKGAETSTRRTVDRQYPFFNVRSEAYWRFREALDPAQPGGSPIALPDDAELVADLTAPRFEIGRRGITIEPKLKVIERMGCSPDKGDAVVMAWFTGPKAATHATIWNGERSNIRRPKVIMGHENQRRKR